ncbi:hypothetical protein GCM10022255_080740 [Dactylosporangium darangshiense]|uniref:Alcohol dehydrogenase-like N-terminal domain-containing protein n=1 Tax=Dactylosporangium darangshiense TaxID=579108 RepID=A0ABP8DL85_9ACTN
MYDRYGPPDVLRIESLPIPSPTAGQVLVRIAATSVNLSDWETLRGTPLYSRIGGLRAPARRTLGSDIAGWVDAVGSGVTRFRPGDEVYGDNLALKGGFAEYAIAPRWRPLDPRELPLAPCGLRLLDYTDIELRLPTTFDDYLRYTVTGINIDSAITRGACSADEARDWCRDTLAPVFAAGDLTVVIPGYLATVGRAADE